MQIALYTACGYRNVRTQSKLAGRQESCSTIKLATTSQSPWAGGDGMKEGRASGMATGLTVRINKATK